MMGVSLASNEYGTRPEPQLRLCGAWLAALNRAPVAEGRFVCEKKHKVRRRAEGAFWLGRGWLVLVGYLFLSTVSQLTCSGSRCRAAEGEHLGRASGSCLHI